MRIRTLTLIKWVIRSVIVFKKKIDFSDYKTSAKETLYFEATESTLVEAKVKFVIDGDTVIVFVSEKEVRVRLDSIDCPEDGQPWGETATAGLIKLIGGRIVQMEVHGEDSYDRTLATIYVEKDSGLINVNERMVMLGHAWVMRRFYNHLPDFRRHRLNRLERWAKSKKVGLWKTENPIPPWKWRKSA